jgi:hypothetical protein
MDAKFVSLPSRILGNFALISAQEHWANEIESGAMDSSQYGKLGYTKCVNGFADAIPGDPMHKFKCKNVSHMTILN